MLLDAAAAQEEAEATAQHRLRRTLETDCDGLRRATRPRIWYACRARNGCGIRDGRYRSFGTKDRPSKRLDPNSEHPALRVEIGQKLAIANKDLSDPLEFVRPQTSVGTPAAQTVHDLSAYEKPGVRGQQLA
jgi:hypothetical protein